MGPLAGKVQVDEVKERVDELLNVCELAYGGYDSLEVKSGDQAKGAYMPTTLLYCDDPNNKLEPHSIEAFGPVSTVMPYRDAEDAANLSKMGMGSLVSSVFTSDNDFAKEIVLNTASMHGRILVLNKDCAKESTGHGSPMPHLVHGGPGRAGGGEEMGGMRGVMHYMQRTAIQGSPTTITKITNEYQAGGEQTFDGKHPFMKMFDELSIGETYITHKRTVTEADIVNFANVSGDHFYAHTDVTSLEGTIFEERVAHGYFIISAAAGLFVDPRKGPVLANYGIDECRFTKPVYVGATIGVKLTVKQKISQEKREDDPCAKGIVKWLVEVYDETDETVALATVLTLVQRKED